MVLDYLHTSIPHGEKWRNAYLVQKTESEDYIGSVSFIFHEQDIIIGYFIAPSYRRQGLATAICTDLVKTLKQYALLLDSTKIKAEVFPDKDASCKVLMKAGFNNLGLKVYDGPTEEYQGKIKYHFEFPLRSDVEHIPKRYPRPTF